MRRNKKVLKRALDTAVARETELIAYMAKYGRIVHAGKLEFLHKTWNLNVRLMNELNEALDSLDNK